MVFLIWLYACGTAVVNCWLYRKCCLQRKELGRLRNIAQARRWQLEARQQLESRRYQSIIQPWRN